MIKKIFITTIFLLSFHFLLSAEVETRYYNGGQTKAQVQSVVKEFETAYGKQNCIITPVKKISEDNYTIEYAYSASGATNKILINYQFFTDRIILSLLDATFISASGKTIIKLTPNNENEKVVKLYNVTKEQFVNAVFKYLKIENNTAPLVFAQDFVTKKYSDEKGMASAKDYSKMYFDYVLKLRSTIKYLGDKTSNNYDVEYTQDEPEGTATILMNFKFTSENFTLTLKSINYYDKVSKAKFPLTSDNSVEWRRKAYETVKKFYLDKQANFMAPEINK